MGKKEAKETKSEVKTKLNKVQQLELRVVELEGEKLMVMADFENFKKRMQKERDELALLGNATILNTLLDIMDDLQRAVDELDTKNEGLEMILDNVTRLLDEQGLERIEANVGDKFDPKRMEAISAIKVTDAEQDGKIVHIERHGYKFPNSDFIIRGCRVIVGKLN